MKFNLNTPTAKLENLKTMLLDAGHEAEIVVGYEHITLKTTPAGEKWIRAQIQKEAEPVAAVPKKKGNWFVTSEPDPAEAYGYDEKMAKRKEINKGAVPFAFICIMIAVAMFYFSTPSGSANTGPKTWKEANAEKFGLSSDFAVKMGLMTNKMVRYPRTKSIEDYRVFTIEPDSVTVVYMYSAENAFGVRSDHSVTVVGDVRTGGIARVVSMQ